MSKILLIDDSRSTLEIAERILEDAGYQVHAYTDGRVALKVLQREAFDLIVTDIYMPELDGLELIREERRLCPHVPIVAMSGMSGKRNMLPVATRMGACQTVPKPFSKADLLSAVGTALGRDPDEYFVAPADQASGFADAWPGRPDEPPHRPDKPTDPTWRKNGPLT